MDGELGPLSPREVDDCRWVLEVHEPRALVVPKEREHVVVVVVAVVAAVVVVVMVMRVVVVVVVVVVRI